MSEPAFGGAPILPDESPELVFTEPHLREVVAEASRARCVAIDVEASGMHAYRARTCLVQLAWSAGKRVAVVDAQKTSLDPLAVLLDRRGPPKVIHDVAFDARLLAESGLSLESVRDTSIAARMLGRLATGLAALLASELGVVIEKTMQHHDWRTRPLDERMMRYLAGDVAHLEALADVLWNELDQAGIEDAVVEETRYRIACAAGARAGDAPDAARAYLRIKGIERLGERELAALRAVAEAREREAETRDVPPHRVASNDALLALARARPKAAADVLRVRGVAPEPIDASPVAHRLAQAIARAGDQLPEDDRALVTPPRLSPAAVKALRGREARLLAWRRAEAKALAVDEQVVLPGHCVKHLALHDAKASEDLAAVPGFGAFRVVRHGQAILAALREESP